jgi:hypothetical protein
MTRTVKDSSGPHLQKVAFALAALASATACDDPRDLPPRTAQDPTPATYEWPGPERGSVRGATYAAAPTASSPPPPYSSPAYPPVPVALPGSLPAPGPLPAPTFAAPGPLPAGTTLGPLLGPAAWQSESREVVKELVLHLSPQNAARVATVPLVFDPNPNEINAFAGCDDKGAPFIAGTEGLLEAIDGISQTKAADELFGTQTYEAYVAIVAPRLVSRGGGSAMLPLGVLPPQYVFEPRRLGRAHEIFDEIVAFTFGHELSHHYLGHTGCANGQAGGPGPAIAQIGQFLAAVAPIVNQPNESAADTSGCINTLDAGAARSPQAPRWTEEGGLWLLDFFARLERASGASPWLGFLRTHPNPGLRIPLVQVVATTWRLQHPRP